MEEDPAAKCLSCLHDAEGLLVHQVGGSETAEDTKRKSMLTLQHEAR